jgi:hypothetical protein
MALYGEDLSGNLVVGEESLRRFYLRGEVEVLAGADERYCWRRVGAFFWSLSALTGLVKTDVAVCFRWGLLMIIASVVVTIGRNVQIAC